MLEYQMLNDKTFMDEFVSFANDVFHFYGGYDDVYEQYDQFSEGEILALLDYCEENELLEE